MADINKKVHVTFTADSSKVAAEANAASASLSRLGKKGEVATERLAASSGNASSSVKRLNNEVSNTSSKLSTLKSIIGVAFFAKLASSAVSAADSYTLLRNRIKLVTDDASQLQAALEGVYKVAQDTRLPMEAIGVTFTRTAQATKELGISQRETLAFTNSLSHAVALSGASSMEAQNAMVQLSQGMATGALRGDELRSVLEQLPAVADVIADGLGVTRGELRKMGEQGEITTTKIISAFAKADERLKKDFAKTVPTVSQAFIVFKNRMAKFADTANEATGFTKGLSKAILGLSNAVGSVESFSEKATGAIKRYFMDFGLAIEAAPLQAQKAFAYAKKEYNDLWAAISNGEAGEMHANRSSSYVEQIQNINKELGEIGRRSMEFVYELGEPPTTDKLKEDSAALGEDTVEVAENGLPKKPDTEEIDSRAVLTDKGIEALAEQEQKKIDALAEKRAADKERQLKEEQDFRKSLDATVTGYLLGNVRKEKASNEEVLKSHQDFRANMLSLASSSSEKLAAIGKAYAIGESVINTYKAANLAMATLPPPFGAIAAAAAIANGLQNVRNIAATNPKSTGLSLSGTATITPLSNGSQNELQENVNENNQNTGYYQNKVQIEFVGQAARVLKSINTESQVAGFI